MCCKLYGRPLGGRQTWVWMPQAGGTGRVVLVRGSRSKLAGTAVAKVARVERASIGRRGRGSIVD